MPKPSCCGESAAHQALAALGPAGPAAPGAMWGVLLGGRAPFHGLPPPTYCGVFPAWARGRGLCGQGPPADSPGRSCLLRGRGRGSWRPPSRQPSADQKGGVAGAQGCRDSPRCMSPQPPTAWLPPASPSDALRQALSSLPFSMGPTSRLRPPCQPCDARPSGLGGTRSGPPSILPSLPSPPPFLRTPGPGFWGIRPLHLSIPAPLQADRRWQCTPAQCCAVLLPLLQSLHTGVSRLNASTTKLPLLGRPVFLIPLLTAPDSRPCEWP